MDSSLDDFELEYMARDLITNVQVRSVPVRLLEEIRSVLLINKKRGLLPRAYMGNISFFFAYAANKLLEETKAQMGLNDEV